MLAVANKNLLLGVEHKNLGRHSVTVLNSVVSDAGALTYDSRNHTIFISDLVTGRIVELQIHSGISRVLPLKGLEKVMSMDYG